ncbi:hypothetical protein WME90_41985 [Sorangium sp. So ce375]|uniref:hypothetical protein n=1 Tax=Sorangium sp. So ce375 TaxID=3133306 RepID=UPI003F5BB4A1
MSELIVLPLGRGPTRDGERIAFAAAQPDGRGVVARVAAASEAEALAEVEKATAGHRVACAPEMAESAAARGWAVRELSYGERLERAHAAVAMFCEGIFDDVSHAAAVIEFLEAARAFEQAWGDRVLWRADVRITGELTGTAHDLRYGVAAYGVPEWMIVALPSEQMARVEAGAARVRDADRLQVALRTEPAAAVAALADAYGLAHVPLPSVHVDGRGHRVDLRFLTWLTVIMYAIKNRIAGHNGTRYTPMVGGDLLAAVGDVVVG